MHKLNFILSVFIVFNTFAGEFSDTLIKQTNSLINSSLASNVGYKVIESLTTEVGARKAGTEAEKRARDWAVRKLVNLGLKNVRVEKFMVKHWMRTIELARVENPFPQQLNITALGGSISTPERGVVAPIVRFKTLNDFKRSPLKGVEGKIVFVDEIMTRTQDGSGYSVAVKKRSGAAVEAGKRGALAALIRSVGTDSDRFPHTGQMRYEDGIKKVPIAALSAPDADQLARMLKKKNKVTVRINIQVEDNKGDVESGNVIAEIPGQTDDIILLGAHLDSWDLGTGAVDDGAGVGIIVGAAAEILKLGVKPLRTIRIVLYGSEEVGIIGAKAYVKAHNDELKKHIIATESDFGAAKVWRFDTKFPKDKVKLGDDIQKLLEPLGIARGHNDASGGPDIYPLQEAGVPTVRLKQNGWDYFDLHHTANDTLDKIKPDDIAQNVAAYAVMTWLFANIKEQFR